MECSNGKYSKDSKDGLDALFGIISETFHLYIKMLDEKSPWCGVGRGARAASCCGWVVLKSTGMAYLSVSAPWARKREALKG